MEDSIKFDVKSLPTPAYIIEETLLIKNLETLKYVSERTGCKILLAQKAFSMFSVYPLLEKYLQGTTASSLYEARLGKEEMKGEVHIFSPAYREDEMKEIVSYCDHIVFNSFSQWKKYKAIVKANSKKIECGIRINPEYSEIETDMYNPCFTGSRMGVTLSQFEPEELSGIDGLHFHTMCEQNADVLERTLKVVDEKFGTYLKSMKWINFGGGHHITRPDYDIETLIRCILFIKEKYQIDVYLEPGEAVALNTGFLVARVLDTLNNGLELAILDTSAACHMPDVLEMPYRPQILGAGMPGELPYTYRLGGPTCLAGDVIGDYSFKEPLEPGDYLVFCDMGHYTMVKNNTFNGVGLPAIAIHSQEKGTKVIKQFGYDDFKMRLS
ncbi:carboxynorspermidine decarboxylase [Anaerocolumna cellulosilytica]|uniref:Carboxynorspermidine decarboxylase n=1 Tax=Anaerocolumna cellulosilytica TaxID=433286 RepID=A0A6S6R0S3_9FIRM|nr:carboxynorspermidine decarboxylase [Anaerocolumna cellulosilytica]MBB5193855.1 carboxynorspermidine decarboxylase [Anaerocolumna cellulosilytica]BCJ94929.1 carboxynorspermidine decarboxylase [Anaerocolumna cellulosilytica]